VRLRRENVALRTEVSQLRAEREIIGESPALQRIMKMISATAPTRATVLLQGDSGTGKELLARALHNLSDRSDGPFITVNCAALPDQLVESIMFGHEKGAFTGAVRQVQGAFERAHRGTLLLDEIGDLPHSLQAKLLRFLQERVIERLGGRQEIAIDVRIVCATHQDLKTLISENRFREDLYYRLAEIVINIPPLRTRQGDAALLAHAFVRRFAAEQKRPSMTLRDDALRAIEAHSWPGNVRELENCIKRAVIMADGNHITIDDIGLNRAEDDLDKLDLRQVREDAEKRVIINALGRVDGNVLKAAEMLGISRPTLYDFMHRFGLK
jgi:two-component system, NtrC family, response regulator